MSIVAHRAYTVGSLATRLRISRPEADALLTNGLIAHHRCTRTGWRVVLERDAATYERGALAFDLPNFDPGHD